mgnify:CR=1 FL=1
MGANVTIPKDNNPNDKPDIVTAFILGLIVGAILAIWLIC